MSESMTEHQVDARPLDNGTGDIRVTDNGTGGGGGRLTPGEDPLVAAHERLTAAVERLVSGEDWAAMLAVASRLHRYSLNNVLLIQSQMPDATRVAGYRTWQALGRQVRKGEHGLAILAPVLRRVPAGEPDATGERGREPAREKDAAPKRQVLTGFKVTKTFDISQTDGPPLPDVVPEQLLGDAPAALYEGLAGQVTAAGFTLVREDCSPAYGRTDFAKRTVVVRPDLSPAQAAKTLAHELAHTALHDDPKFLGHSGFSCRGLAEVEAESVAYLVCTTAGLATDGYTFPYVARWASGDVAVVRSAAERSLGAARAITTTLGLTTSRNDEATDAVLARASSVSRDRSSVPGPAPTFAPALRRAGRSVAR